MLMRKQMILTILIISIAFGTESEFQVRIVLLCSAADCAFVLGDTSCCRIDSALCDRFLELSSSVNFLRIISLLGILFLVGLLFIDQTKIGEIILWRV